MVSRVFPHAICRCVALLFSLFLIASIQAQEPDKKYVSIELIADRNTVAAGGRVVVGIVQTIAPKWHVYWVNPGDSGEATRVQWQGLADVTASPIAWPVPKKLPFGPLTNYGYEERVVLLQELSFPSDLPTGSITLYADISLLVCEEICIPEEHQASITFNNGAAAYPELIAAARTKLPVPLTWPASYTRVGDDIELRVAIDDPVLFYKALDSIEVFFVEPGLIANHGQPRARLVDQQLVVIQERGELEAESIPDSTVLVAYRDPAGVRQAIALEATSSTPPVAKDTSSALSLTAALLFALVGGFILNLMPCVFPVLSLKAFSLMQMQDQSQAEARAHGLAYALGVILSFLVIALVLLALKAGGMQIGWGFQLQNPHFVFFLAMLLFLVGLNLIGFFQVGGQWINTGATLADKKGRAGSFFTGMLATVVATPCTAPFMGVAMGYALSQSAIVALAVFTALGLGLALPYLLLCFLPPLRRALPAPGAWMEKFKEFLAFPMFATAAWLVWVLDQQVDDNGVLLALMAMVGISLGIWFGKNGRRNRLIYILSALVILGSLAPIVLINQRGNDAVSANDNSPWQPFTHEALDLALASSSPVFVNMTAAWCITCKVNERVALNTSETQTLFDREGIVYLKGDWTNFNADITHYLESHGRNGVPIYVFYGAPDKNTGQRPAPRVLPQILTSSIVAEFVDRTNGP